jgi:cytochrome c-type biogenesis protein
MASRSNVARTIAVGLVALTLLLSLCLSSEGPSKGDQAPDFSVKDVDGISHSLDDYEGRVLVMEFFATWCTYCYDQIPVMKELQNHYSESDVAILWVDSDDRESKEKVAEWRVDQEITWPMAYKAGSMGEAYGVEAFPTTFIIDQEGVVQYYHAGVSSASTLKEVIDDLL